MQYKIKPHLSTQVACGKEYLDFQMLDAFDILDLQGNKILTNVSPKRKWRVRRLNYSEPQYQYYLSLGFSPSEKEANKLMNKQKIKDIQTQIRSIGGPITIGGKEISENILFEVMLGGFNTSEEIELFKAHHSNLDGEIKSEIIREVRGTLEVCDDEYIQSAQIENGIIVKPVTQNNKFRISGLSTSRKHKRVLPTQTSYRGDVRFVLNAGGGIDAIHDISLERYLQGIIAALGTQFHPEALKSFAIVARTWLLSQMHLRHPREPYHFCFHHHCLPFCGSADFPKEISLVVNETRGQVLKYNDQLHPVSFTVNCGGQIDVHSILPGLSDSSTTKPQKLTNEKDFEKWVKEGQSSFCNKHQSGNNPELNHLFTNYRWEISYSRSDIEGILSANLNVSIGHLYDIVEGERTAGGRLLSLEIIGSKKNRTIHGAENIRTLFHPKSLPSHAFYIEKIRDDEGIPIEYVFSGAGEGEGLGICIAGASYMASNNSEYSEIIRHFFPKSTIVKLY